MRPEEAESVKTTVTLPKWQVRALDRLRAGRSRSELIAQAVEDLLRSEERRRVAELMKQGYESTAERDLALCQEMEGSHPGAPEY